MNRFYGLGKYEIGLQFLGIIFSCKPILALLIYVNENQ